MEFRKWALQDRSSPDAAVALIARRSFAAQRDGILAVHGSRHNPLMGPPLRRAGRTGSASRTAGMAMGARPHSSGCAVDQLLRRDD